jgi:hypothetical protein
MVEEADTCIPVCNRKDNIFKYSTVLMKKPNASENINGQ